MSKLLWLHRSFARRCMYYYCYNVYKNYKNNLRHTIWYLQFVFPLVPFSGDYLEFKYLCTNSREIPRQLYIVFSQISIIHKFYDKQTNPKFNAIFLRRLAIFPSEFPLMDASLPHLFERSINVYSYGGMSLPIWCIAYRLQGVLFYTSCTEVFKIFCA